MPARRSGTRAKKLPKGKPNVWWGPSGGLKYQPRGQRVRSIGPNHRDYHALKKHARNKKSVKKRRSRSAAASGRRSTRKMYKYNAAEEEDPEYSHVRERRTTAIDKDYTIDTHQNIPVSEFVSNISTPAHQYGRDFLHNVQERFVGGPRPLNRLREDQLYKYLDRINYADYSTTGIALRRRYNCCHNCLTPLAPEDYNDGVVKQSKCCLGCWIKQYDRGDKIPGMEPSLKELVTIRSLMQDDNMNRDSLTQLSWGDRLNPMPLLKGTAATVGLAADYAAFPSRTQWWEENIGVKDISATKAKRYRAIRPQVTMKDATYKKPDEAGRFDTYVTNPLRALWATRPGGSRRTMIERPHDHDAEEGLKADEGGLSSYAAVNVAHVMPSGGGGILNVAHGARVEPTFGTGNGPV